MPTATGPSTQAVEVVDRYQKKYGKPFFPWQRDAFYGWITHANPKRELLYYRTGGGKTLTAMTMLAIDGWSRTLVIAPPSTHAEWVKTGVIFGIYVECVSHAKFRERSYQLSRSKPVIADEFHLFGGAGAMGWKKLDRLAAKLKAPMILASATPNYNDAERCYCIQHVLDPASCRGGLLEFIHKHCDTTENPYGRMPIVNGFRNYTDASGYLAALPHVVYLPDNVVATINDVQLQSSIPDEFEEYGLNRRTGRIMASAMEAKHQTYQHNIVGENGFVRPHVFNELVELVGQATTPVIIFCASSTIAEAVMMTAELAKANALLVTGKTSPKKKQAALDQFRTGKVDILIGTATLATGTDGLDKVCDTMIIVNDTEDPALRRQLMGRILPRGEDVDASNKQFFRLAF